MDTSLIDWTAFLVRKQRPIFHDEDLKNIGNETVTENRIFWCFKAVVKPVFWKHNSLEIVVFVGDDNATMILFFAYLVTIGWCVREGRKVGNGYELLRGVTNNQK